jgi:hypothetical protein
MNQQVIANVNFIWETADGLWEILIMWVAVKFFPDGMGRLVCFAASTLTKLHFCPVFGKIANFAHLLLILSYFICDLWSQVLCKWNYSALLYY